MIPEGMTEEQVLAAIENAVRVLAPSFVFGIYGLADVQQEIRIFCMEALPRYDSRPDENGLPTRPLENFLYTHASNRSRNLKRDKLRRTDYPCLICARAEGKVTEHEDGQFCRKFLVWRKRNDAKAGLMRPLQLDRVPDDRKSDASGVEDEANLNDTLTRIDAELPVQLRAAYLSMRAGHPVPKSQRAAVVEAVREIMGYDQEG